LDQVKDSAAGAMNFLVFSLSAFVGLFFGFTLAGLSGGHELTVTTFQSADWIWIVAVVLSFVLTLFLRETGLAANPAKAATSGIKA
ncbi:MAG TPA: hypothetical protein VGI36_14600, partial [Candidatus Binataceae bacterium]